MFWMSVGSVSRFCLAAWLLYRACIYLQFALLDQCDRYARGVIHCLACSSTLAPFRLSCLSCPRQDALICLDKLFLHGKRNSAHQKPASGYPRKARPRKGPAFQTLAPPQVLLIARPLSRIRNLGFNPTRPTPLIEAL